MAEELLVKSAQAGAWDEVEGRESTLVARCAQGDQAACAELVAEHQRMVYQLAFHLLGDRDEALDLSQEVFMRVFRTLSQFRGQSAAAHLDLSHRRQPGAQPSALVEAPASCQPGLARSASRDAWRAVGAEPAGRARQHARAEASWPRSSGTRSTRCRSISARVVILREIDGLSYDEIAFSLGVDAGDRQVAPDPCAPGAARWVAGGGIMSALDRAAVPGARSRPSTMASCPCGIRLRCRPISQTAVRVPASGCAACMVVGATMRDAMSDPMLEDAQTVGRRVLVTLPVRPRALVAPAACDAVRGHAPGLGRHGRVGGNAGLCGGRGWV